MLVSLNDHDTYHDKKRQQVGTLLPSKYKLMSSLSITKEKLIYK